MNYELHTICLPCALSVRNVTSHSLSRLVQAGLQQWSATVAVDVPIYRRRRPIHRFITGSRRLTQLATNCLTRVQLAGGPITCLPRPPQQLGQGYGSAMSVLHGALSAHETAPLACISMVFGRIIAKYGIAENLQLDSSERQQATNINYLLSDATLLWAVMWTNK